MKTRTNTDPEKAPALPTPVIPLAVSAAASATEGPDTRSARKVTAAPLCDHHWTDDVRSSVLEEREREDAEARDPYALLPGHDEPIWLCSLCDEWHPATECETCGDLVDPDGNCACDEGRVSLCVHSIAVAFGATPQPRCPGCGDDLQDGNCDRCDNPMHEGE